MKKFIFLSITIFFTQLAVAATIRVKSGDNLNDKISRASGGDVVLVEPGIYSEVDISNRKFTVEKPLVIRGTKATGIVIKRNTMSSGTAFRIIESSHLLVENLTIDGGMWGYYITKSHNIIITKCEVRNTGREGIHITNPSRNVDIVNCHIHHTEKFKQKLGRLTKVIPSYFATAMFPLLQLIRVGLQ